jgi:hypothetical protein
LFLLPPPPARSKFTFKKEPTGIFKLLLGLPHWLLISTKLQGAAPNAAP